ncbi:hypothetical protein LMK05_07410 [Lactococcus petauri]|nr:hypothetical protein LMK05_07410 [Lactococcus petauri]
MKKKKFEVILLAVAALTGLSQFGHSMNVEASTTKAEVEAQNNTVQHGIYTLAAKDVTVEVGETDFSSIISAAHATATNVIASEIPMAGPDIKVIIKSSTVKDTPGKYEVTFGISEDSQLTKKVEITVVSQKDDITENGTYSIKGSDVTLLIGQADNETIIEKAKGYAVNSVGNAVDVIVKKSNVNKDVEGQYQVVLGIKEDSELKLTVNVTIVGSLGETPSLNMIRAYDATVDSSHIDDSSILSAATAVVINAITGAEVDMPIHIKSSNVTNEAGVYQVTLGTDDSSIADKIIQVIVFDKAGDDSGGHHALPNENFNLK